MRRISAAFAAAAVLTGVAAAQAPFTDEELATADRLIETAQGSDLGYRIIESLTTEVGPRLAGTEAEARGRDWAVAKFEELGLRNIRVEPFETPLWVRRSESAEIVAPFPQALSATALGGSVGTPEGGITAEVVRFASLTELRAVPDGSLDGKIAFIDEGMTRAQDGSGYGPAVLKRSQGASAAAVAGASAVIIRSVGTDQSRSPHTGGMRYALGIPRIPAAAVSNIDADQLARALERGAVTVKLDLDVETIGDAQSGNVIAEIPGRTDEIILLGAHLDSWDLGTGAVDDGAGVGIVMAAAKHVADLPGRPQRTIRVVLFGSEENGIYGGRFYSVAHADELDRHVVAAESDFGAGRVWRMRARTGEGAREAIETIQQKLAPLGVIMGQGAGNGGPDVAPSVARGVPAIDLDQNGLRYFDLHHTPEDTFDKIDEADVAQNVAAYAAMAWLVSEMDGDLRDPGEVAEAQDAEE